MGEQDWMIYVVVLGAAWLVLGRLERLGMQLEAVCLSIKVELARSEDRKRELVSEWHDNQKQVAKDARRFWWTLGVIGARIVGWVALTKLR